MKFAVMGLGGVGGTLGSLLVRGGQDVAFVARGAHLQAIRQGGLRLNSGISGEYTAVPRIATDDPSEIGPVDCVILAIKGFALKDAVESLKPIVNKDTVVISTLNGVGNAERVAKFGVDAIVADSGMYIFAEITEPGHVTHHGRSCRIVMGGKYSEADEERVREVVKVFNDCDITAEFTDNAEAETWKKFTLINSSTCTQAYYNATSGQVREDDKKLDTFKAVVAETLAVARAKGVELPDDFADKILDTYLGFDYGATTSIQRDLEEGRNSEFPLFAGYIVEEADALGVSVPVHKKIVEKLA